MKSKFNNQNSLEPSYNKKKISNRLSELKNKYQDLLIDLKESSIDNIDRVFGYSHSDIDDVETDLFIDKINENLEIQDKIKILKQNIAQKIQNIEKINSLNTNNKSYDELKNQISDSLAVINKFDVKTPSSNGSTGINNEQYNELLSKIDNLHNGFQTQLNKLTKTIDVKDEALYKDEISFLKHQIDELLIENKECKAKLSELISINNQKEEEINKSYSAWIRNSAKLNDLETLLLQQKEQHDSLDSEKDEVIDQLASKINQIKTENDVYEQFSNDVSNKNNDELLKAIETKIDALKDEIINSDFSRSHIGNGSLIDNATINQENHETIKEETENSDINELLKFMQDELSKDNVETTNINQDNQKEIKVELVQNDKRLNELSKEAKEYVNNQKINLLNELIKKYKSQFIVSKELTNNLVSQIDEIVLPPLNDSSSPSDNLDDIKNQLIDLDEYMNFDVKKDVDDKSLFSRLYNINNLGDFKKFAQETSDVINHLVETLNQEKEKLIDYLTNNELFEFNFNELNQLIKELNLLLEEMSNHLNKQTNVISDDNQYVNLDTDISKSTYWYDFIDNINELLTIANNQSNLFDNVENELDVLERLKNNKPLVNNSKHHNGDYSDLLNENKKLKLIFSKLNNLEKLVEVYEMNQFEEFVEKI